MIDTIIRYLITFFIVFLIYSLYVALLKPFLFWIKYKKYSNVATGAWFIPVIGDLKKHLDCVKSGKVHYAHLIENGKTVHNYDMRVKIEGISSCIAMCSKQAVEEFLALQTEKIDKVELTRGISVMIEESMANRRTTKLTKERRKNFTKWMGLNSASQYIPGILDC